MLRFPLIILLVLCATVSFAQSKKKRNKKAESPQQQSTSLSPYFPSKDYEPEKKGKDKKKSKSRKATYNAMDEHESRMKAVVKENRKAEKEMLKPQYSDPSYFGHKRKPKKRSPDKMKFCKICEIRH